MRYIQVMKRRLVLVFIAAALPAAAQEAEDPPSLMERGAQMFLEGLMAEVEPRLDDLQGLAQEFGSAMRGFFTEMGPAFRDLLSEVEDWSAYHPPEILPNGDIIIRRKAENPPADSGEEDAPKSGGPIDL